MSSNQSQCWLFEGWAAGCRAGSCCGHSSTAWSCCTALLPARGLQHSPELFPELTNPHVISALPSVWLESWKYWEGAGASSPSDTRLFPPGSVDLHGQSWGVRTPAGLTAVLGISRLDFDLWHLTKFHLIQLRAKICCNFKINQRRGWWFEVTTRKIQLEFSRLWPRFPFEQPLDGCLWQERMSPRAAPCRRLLLLPCQYRSN